MALKRWSWLWGPCLAAVVAAIALLPPGHPSGKGLSYSMGYYTDWSDSWSDSHHTFREGVHAAVDEQRRRLQETQRADSLVSLAHGTHAVRSADDAAAVVFEAPLTSDSARFWLRAATGELGLYPSRGPMALRVVVALYSNPARSRDSAQAYRWWTVRELRSSAVSGGDCVIEVNLLASGEAANPRLVARDRAGNPISRFLGMCALYGRFGVPGRRIAQWVGDQPGWWWYGSIPLSVVTQEAGRPVRRRDLVQSTDYYELPWSERACLRGETDACVRPTGFTCQDMDWRGDCSHSPYFTPHKLLAYLLNRGTPAQFSAFWRSSLPPQTALASAYGEPAGELVRTAYAHWFTATIPGGPRAGLRVIVAGLAWAGLALALAVVAGRRWTTEI